jgi:hypothetical protein
VAIRFTVFVRYDFFSAISELRTTECDSSIPSGDCRVGVPTAWYFYRGAVMLSTIPLQFSMGHRYHDDQAAAGG